MPSINPMIVLERKQGIVIQKTYMNMKNTFITSLHKCCFEASNELDDLQDQKNQMM